MDEWKPRQSDIDWTREHLNSISEGGHWVIPSAGGSIFTFYHTTKTYEAIVNATHAPEMHVALQTMTVLEELGYKAGSLLVDSDGSLIQSHMHKFQKENM
ncbi:MAG: hypothetical protein CMB45_05115 [Euryarchaeota archaeon]|nr:hypothetical protein [Euryarchaeota archaeon]|tara:strand:- start:9062 stop:9361 length:300 start_codon:yes stop_codon:yes gene_type:complete